MFSKRKHIGRTQIRLSSLENVPEEYNTWHELWRKHLAIGNVSEFTPRKLNSENIGALKVRLLYSRVLVSSTDSQSSIHSEDSDVRVSRKIEDSETRLFDSCESEDIPQEENSEEVDLGDSSILFRMYTKFAGKDSLPTMNNIRKLLLAFGQGMDISTSALAAALIALEIFYRRIAKKHTCDFSVPREMIDKGRHLYKFSMATYGWKGLNYAGKGNGLLRDSFRKRSDFKSVQEYLNVPECDIFKFEQNSSIHKCSFYIAVDWHTESIVLSIRGTVSMSETLIDLDCEYCRWKNGFVHSGILKTAKWLSKYVNSELSEACDKFGFSKVSIVGHSLGAGVAAISTVLLNERNPEINFNCYAYAPPPVMSYDLAIQYKDTIFSFVYGTDVVCSLSYGAMLDLKELILCACDYGNPSDLLLEPSTKKRMEQMEALEICLHKIIEKSHNTKLYLPGAVYHMYRLPLPNAPKNTVIEVSDPKLFEQVEIRQGMFKNHLPKSYDSALNYVFEASMIKAQNSAEIE